MPLDGAPNHLRYLILGIQAEGERRLSAALQGAGTDVTPTQSEVLEVLCEQGSMSQADLGDRLVCTKGNISRLLDRMEAKDLLRREDDPEDRRRFRVVVTDRGRAEFSKAEGAIEDILAMLDALYEPSELQQLIGLLGRAAAALDVPLSTRGFATEEDTHAVRADD